MADAIERLYRVTVDGTSAINALNKISSSADNIDKKLDAASKAGEAFGKKLVAALSVGAIVAGFKRVIDSMDEVVKSAQSAGVTAEEWQKLAYAADLSGVSAQSMGTALGKLSVQLVEVDTATTDAAKALRAMGVTAKDTSGEALAKIADQFAKMPDGAEKTAAAIKLFGKAGAEMIPLLNGGSAALKELGDEAERYGAVIGGNTLKQAEAFNDNLTRLGTVSKGIAGQITAGLLPAFVAITDAMAGAARSGDGFKSAGEKVGQLLLEVSGYALKAAATIEAVGLTIGAVFAAIANPGDALTIFKELTSDIDALEVSTNKQVAALQKTYDEQVKLASLPAPVVVKPETPKLLRDTTEATKAQAKAQKELTAQLVKMAEAADEANFALAKLEAESADTSSAVVTFNNEYIKANQSIRANAKAAEEQTARFDVWVDMLENGTEAQKQYAQAQLLAAGTAKDATDNMAKQSDELSILSEGFEGFFENLARGTADVEDLFRRMVQSIIAELLKLWAKKYIVDTIVKAFGVSTTASAQGNVFDAGQVVPFARGGVISRPIMFPMALAGEAGPEAILPLTRGPNGNLGVESTAPAMNVTVNNYSTATVSTRQTSPYDIEVIVENTRQAIAADLRAGGNAVSNSFESAYGIGRGAAAPF